jgi:hypothetical protein
MSENGKNREGETQSPVRPHEEFLELCAVSTSGDLSEEEQRRLREHLAICAECRQALEEFEAAADIGVPLLSSALSVSSQDQPRPCADAVLEPKPNSGEQSNGLVFAHHKGRVRTHMNWSYVWMSLAAATVLAAVLGIYSYQFGRLNGQQVVQVTAPRSDPRVGALEEQISDAGHEREVLKEQLTQRDEKIAELERQTAQQSAELAEVRGVQQNLQHSVQNEQGEKQQAAEERSDLVEKLEVAQASLQKTQTELDSIKQQRSQDQLRAEGLEAQMRDLNGLLRDREQTIGQQEELLAHDRDIRDLMGARDLYIAEVYDVARDGSTQKPYGRVFYTKGKSLIFYAYDLDKQPGVKNASTFQAWGRGGPDRQQLLNLGVFYQDSVAKKRWVLKFDDPHTLEQLDAVFVTVEPAGGSHKPSTRPLLFASLHIQPNHP